MEPDTKHTTSRLNTCVGKFITMSLQTQQSEVKRSQVLGLQFLETLRERSQ
jgi:hypothetical protein